MQTGTKNCHAVLPQSFARVENGSELVMNQRNIPSEQKQVASELVARRKAEKN